MTYSLKQAAAACGRSKSTVYGALKSKKIKHTLDEKGQFRIEPEDLAAWLAEQPKNVQAEHEKTSVTDEKHRLYEQKIESLERTVAHLTEERNEWRGQAKAAAATIEHQATALATATAASARAITQADEMRRQMLAIEATKPAPPPSAPVPTEATSTGGFFALRPWFWPWWNERK